MQVLVHVHAWLHFVGFFLNIHKVCYFLLKVGYHFVLGWAKLGYPHLGQLSDCWAELNWVA